MRFFLSQSINKKTNKTTNNKQQKTKQNVIIQIMLNKDNIFNILINSSIGLLVYLKYVYFNDKYELELFDKIFIPFVYILIANVTIPFLIYLILDLYIFLIHTTMYDIDKLSLTVTNICKEFIVVLICVITELCYLSFIGLFFYVNYWILKRYWPYIGHYIPTEF